MLLMPRVLIDSIKKGAVQWERRVFGGDTERDL